MSTLDYLFVGGSRDGERHAVEDGADVVSIQIEQERPFPDASSPVVVEIGPTIEEVYQRTNCLVDGAYTAVFAHESIGPEELEARLA